MMRLDAVNVDDGEGIGVSTLLHAREESGICSCFPDVFCGVDGTAHDHAAVVKEHVARAGRQLGTFQNGLERVRDEADANGPADRAAFIFWG